MEFNKQQDSLSLDFISATFPIQVVLNEMQTRALSLANACPHHHTILPYYFSHLLHIEKWQKSILVWLWADHKERLGTGNAY